MPDNTQPHFEEHPLEKDIKQIESEVKTVGGENFEREHLKSVLERRIYEPQVQRQPTAPQAVSDTSASLPNYMKSSSDGDKSTVEGLVNLAYHKGLETAVNEAKKYSPFILDAFHDALTDKLYAEFKIRGLIK